MISDDLAEMLAGKESELECALAQVARLKTELEQAQLQASISARFSPSKSAPHYGRPSSVSGSPQAQRHSQDGRPSSFSGALDDSRASADTGRDEEVERVLEEMAANKRAAIRVKELEQQVALNVSHIERYEFVSLTDGDARAFSHSRQLDGDEGAWQGSDGAILDIRVGSFDVPHVQHVRVSVNYIVQIRF